MDTGTIRAKIYSKIDELPTLPTVVMRILSLIEDANTNTTDITEAISLDPALTSKVLKIANSAYYGFSQLISDLERAVALLGFNMVKSLALSIGVMKTLPSEKKSTSFSERELWLHSVTVATIIKEMGKKIGMEKDHEYLFIIGLLHDIGIIVLDQFFNELFQEILKDPIALERGKLYEAERKVLGFDHGEVAAILLNRWKFPNEIIKPIVLHHSTKYPEDFAQKETAMLRIANAISYYTPEEEIEEMIYKRLKPDLDILNMSREKIDYLISYSSGIEEEIESFFNAMI